MNLIKVQAFYLEGFDEQEERYISEKASLDYFEIRSGINRFRRKIKLEYRQAHPKQKVYSRPLVQVSCREQGLLPIDYKVREGLIRSSWIAYNFDYKNKTFLLADEHKFLMDRVRDIWKHRTQGTFLEAAWIDGLLNSLEMGEI